MLFKDWLSQENLDYTEAGARFGVSRITVYYWATGMNRPSPKYNYIIAEKTNGLVTANDHQRAYELNRENEEAHPGGAGFVRPGADL
tara:strand:+ start:570 stop:830 length:261 start_codon:yes stop_codon:yes gene_type:complete